MWHELGPKCLWFSSLNPSASTQGFCSVFCQPFDKAELSWCGLTRSLSILIKYWYFPSTDSSFAMPVTMTPNCLAVYFSGYFCFFTFLQNRCHSIICKWDRSKCPSTERNREVILANLDWILFIANLLKYNSDIILNIW